MDFPALLEHLKALRDLTNEQDDARSILDRLPDDRAAAEQKLAAARKAADDAEAAAKHAAAESKRIDATLRELDTKKSHYKSQLPQARTMEAMNALNHEIETCEKKQAELEDQGIEWIEKEETGRAAAATARTRVADLETATTETLERIATRESETRDRLRLAEEETANRLASLAEADRKTWETIARRHGGASVLVPLVDGARCGGCDMGVVLNTREGVASGRKTTRCEHCGRILYDTERFG